ncbi:hypothetical protein N431DRAFT_198881 [Stipitochalara longipes BDJ]|nr:hypothetical protein N431DRAFT_198881 [Stipitochalara longipes BDJ]
MKPILEMREKLKEYNTAIVQQIAISQQASPSKGSLEYLRMWVADVYGLASDLRGPGSRIWFAKEGGEYKLDDNVSIWPEGSGRDGFTILIFKALKLLSNFRVPSFLSYFFWKRTFPAFQLDGLHQGQMEGREINLYLDSGAIVRVGDKIVTVISCLLVTIPVIVLHYVTNTGIRLGLIVAFALLFSLALVSTSDASRKEIFAATAAFVAVQVVYVGSAGGP